ncbi:MAG: glycerophosphodiester phosphodiesterase [Flavobacteriaceae bacterium]|nr:glycerophosphodiester phosphodiesterase [Flavobacteriaceae bacterium]
MSLAKGKIKVCIEIKVYGIEEDVLKIINDLGMNEQVIIFSFYYPVISKIRKLDENTPILYLKGYADKNTIDYAKMINSKAIGVGSKTVITKDFIDLAHSHGIEVWKYTIDDEEKMQNLIDLKLDGLITNYPDKATKKIQNMN